VVASIEATDQSARVASWSPADATTRSPKPSVDTDPAILVIDAGDLLDRDSGGQLVDAWLVLLFLAATADALWALAAPARTWPEPTASRPLTQADAREAIAQAQRVRLAEGSAIPAPSDQALLWTGWTRIYQVFGMTLDGMRRLFATQRSAGPPVVEVPPAVVSKLGTVAELAAVLEHRLKPERITAVVRGPADAYGGLSMLQMIEADRQEDLLRQVRATFNWGSTA
jgi:hypothetical protein